MISPTLKRGTEEQMNNERKKAMILRINSIRVACRINAIISIDKGKGRRTYLVRRAKDSAIFSFYFMGFVVTV